MAKKKGAKKQDEWELIEQDLKEFQAQSKGKDGIKQRNANQRGKKASKQDVKQLKKQMEAKKKRLHDKRRSKQTKAKAKDSDWEDSDDEDYESNFSSDEDDFVDAEMDEEAMMDRIFDMSEKQQGKRNTKDDDCISWGGMLKVLFLVGLMVAVIALNAGSEDFNIDGLNMNAPSKDYYKILGAEVSYCH